MTTPFPVAAPVPMALRCPKCAADMTTYERSGIVVDQCRECRGIFLDRGELERLVDIESGTGWTGPRMAAPPPVDPRQLSPRPPVDPRAAGYRPDWHDWDDDDRDDRMDRDDRRRSDGRSGRPPKRRSILGELLEGLGD